MQWHPLNEYLPPEPLKLSKQATAVCESINEALAEVHARRRKHDAEQAALASTTTSDFSAKHVARSQALETDLIDVLRLELAVRQRIEKEWFGRRTAERARAADAAQEHVEAVFARIAAKLIEIGYLPSEIAPDLVARHPEAYTAAEAHHAARSRVHEASDQQPNSIAIDLLTRDLERRITKAMGGSRG